MFASDRTRPVWRALAASCLVLSCIGAHAADSKKDQEQMRRLRQQLQQLQQEQATQQEAATRATQEKAAAEADLKKTRAEADAAKAASSRKAAVLSKDLQVATTERDALKAQLEEARAQLEKTGADLKATREKLAARDTQWAQLDASHKAQSASLASCVQHNVRLYQLGSELLTRWENKGLSEVLAQNEPFAQLKRVELENLADDYRDKLARERQPAGAASAP
ncbi:MAG: hypothetical protein EPO12_07110 [Aquabacterium sp.]|nr:MAG: hypothetical protein EPO12_07110 [Aquabacterium sp.]